MKLHYSKAEITDRIQRKALWATPIEFKENATFKRLVYLTNLDTGYIRASFRLGGKDYDLMIPDCCKYSEVRKAIRGYIDSL